MIRNSIYCFTQKSSQIVVMAFSSSNFQLVITYKIVCFIVFFPIVIFRIVSCKFHTFENNACTLLITYLTTCVHHQYSVCVLSRRAVSNFVREECSSWRKLFHFNLCRKTMKYSKLCALQLTHRIAIKKILTYNVGTFSEVNKLYIIKYKEQ